MVAQSGGGGIGRMAFLGDGVIKMFARLMRSCSLVGHTVGGDMMRSAVGRFVVPLGGSHSKEDHHAHQDGHAAVRSGGLLRRAVGWFIRLEDCTIGRMSSPSGGRCGRSVHAASSSQ